MYKRQISHQFHDDITGTSLQRVYKRSWNDYALSLNQFEAEYEHSLGSVADCMDTSWVKGVAVVVNNSLAVSYTHLDVYKRQYQHGGKGV